MFNEDEQQLRQQSGVISHKSSKGQEIVYTILVDSHYLEADDSASYQLAESEKIQRAERKMQKQLETEASLPTEFNSPFERFE